MSEGGLISSLPRFQSIERRDVPTDRASKHKQIVMDLLTDIERLEAGYALKVPIVALTDTKENIRSALKRATDHRGIEIATSSDENSLYIWKVAAR